MPLVTGRDAFGRPIYADPGDAQTTAPVSPGQLTQAVDEVDPTRETLQYKSALDYQPFANRNETIRSQGSFATNQAVQAAQAALQARLLKAQTAANAAVTSAASKYGSGQTPAGNTGTIIYNGGNASDLRSRLVAKVASQKGTWYKWGGESPKTGFDCSGLVQWAYGKLGIKMPRTSGPQAHMGVKTSIKNLRPGDLVAHPGHIAVYAGNGMMWEAPHTGAQVRLVPVRSNMYGVHLTLPGD